MFLIDRDKAYLDNPTGGTYITSFSACPWGGYINRGFTEYVRTIPDLLKHHRMRFLVAV